MQQNLRRIAELDVALPDWAFQIPDLAQLA
jgi:hypothetical protein